jgi:hypothetical protein
LIAPVVTIRNAGFAGIPFLALWGTHPSGMSAGFVYDGN